MKLKLEMALADQRGDWKRRNELWEEIARLTEKVLDSITWDGNNTEDVIRFVKQNIRESIYEVKDHIHGYYHQRCLTFEPVNVRIAEFHVFIGIPVLYVDCCFGKRLRREREPDIIKD